MMLVDHLETTGGQEEEGVKTIKADLKKAVLERLGMFEAEMFYMLATILDPRYHLRAAAPHHHVLHQVQEPLLPGLSLIHI